jgi:hypothetical protein
VIYLVTWWSIAHRGRWCTVNETQAGPSGTREIESSTGTIARYQTPARTSRALGLGAVALGAFALGATAIGALAIGRLAIGAFAVKRGRVRSLTVEDLEVRRLHVGELTIANGSRGRQE